MVKILKNKTFMILMLAIFSHLLTGCAANIPEFNGLQVEHGNILADYTVAKSIESPISSNKIITANVITSDSPVTNAPHFKVNQEWVYINKDINSTRTIKILEVNSDDYLIKEDYQQIRYDKNMNRIEVVYPPSETHEKTNQYYKFPLFIGQTWEYDGIFKESNTKLHKYHVNCEVISYGRVSVKAGEFNAYKIHEQINAQYQMVSSFYWYSPDVSAIIKVSPRASRSPKSNIELISYTQ